ncbi:MAG: hypothetical protein AB8G99_09740 [Planctomycetaceae bacterium]
MGSLLTQTVALFVRAVRRDSRNLFSHLMRGGLALMLVVILIAAYRQMSVFSASGLSVFGMIMWVNFMFISIAAIGYFSTSITEEKEEGTLGLLRMAGVSPLSLLFGKSVSRLWLAVVLLSIQFPFAMLAITLGGITLRQIAACYIALAGYTFFLSGMATLCSVVTAKSMKAVVYMVVASVVLFLLPSICDAADDLANLLFAIDWIERVEGLTDRLLNLSISSRLNGVLATGFDEPLFDQHFQAHAIGGCFFYLLSWLLFDFFAYRQTDHSPGRAARTFLKKLGLKAGRAWPSSVVWKDYHFGSGGYRSALMRTVLIVAGTALFGWFAWYNRPLGAQFDTRDIGSILCGWSIFLTVIECTIQSIRLLSDEHSQRTLPLLAMTPGSAAGKVGAKAAGLLLGLLPNVIAFILSLYLNPDLLGDYLEEAARDPKFLFVSAYMLIVTLLFFHLSAFFASYVKWAAVPLAFGTLLAFSMLCLFTALGPRASNSTVTVVFFMLDCLGLIAIVGLMAAIVHRFTALQER